MGCNQILIRLQCNNNCRYLSAAAKLRVDCFSLFERGPELPLAIVTVKSPNSVRRVASVQTVDRLIVCRRCTIAKLDDGS